MENAPSKAMIAGNKSKVSEKGAKLHSSTEFTERKLPCNHLSCLLVFQQLLVHIIRPHAA
jgi:hypothetical protein